ncbi:hypothetical protein [Pedobacter arcticus]|uniref:hypothetical protein n=1 Tax=Pedobacter arcticus TaxID=752140 RepID=UPI000312C1CA|nr:hypothetical protein [Pedobacter arcticus]
MKKLFMFAIGVAFGLSSTFAQTTPVKTSTKKAEKKVITESKAMAVKKDESKTVVAKTATAPKTVTTKNTVTTTSNVPLKKDGTPDKRYKAKTNAAGPLKKDGTPDKRFKSNK